MIGGDERHKTIPDSIINCVESGDVFQLSSRLEVPVEKKVACKLGGHDWNVVIHCGNKSETVQPVFHIDIFISMAGSEVGKSEARVLVGDPSMASEVLGIEYAELAMQEHFDDIASQLDEAGFIVIRNPLPLVYCDNMEKRERSWYFASANNVIINNNKKTRIVWMPTYGHGNWPELEITDAINAEVWKKLGYEVRLISGCQPLAENFGGLHCFSKTW